MKGFQLFLRGRRSAHAAALLVVLAGGERLIGNASVTPVGDDSLHVPWVVIVPVIAGTVVGMASRSPMGTWEELAARPMGRLRAMQSVALLGLALALTAVVGAGLDGDQSTFAALRNVVGFVGLGLLSANFFGSPAAWLLPLVTALCSLTLGASRGHVYFWAWPIQPGANGAGIWVAVALLVIGVTIGSLRAGRMGLAEQN